MTNELIEQEKRWMDIFIELTVELDSITEGLKRQVEGFTHKKADDETIRCFNCDVCKETLKPSDSFVKFEIWQSMGLYNTEIIGSTFKIFHVHCWNNILATTDKEELFRE